MRPIGRIFFLLLRKFPFLTNTSMPISMPKLLHLDNQNHKRNHSAWPQSVSFFWKKKRWKSGTLCEHLPKMYYFWTIIHGLYYFDRKILIAIFVWPKFRCFWKKSAVFTSPLGVKIEKYIINNRIVSKIQTKNGLIKNIVTLWSQDINTNVHLKYNW